MTQKKINFFFVFCLAGLGKRFTDTGIDCPKYLLSFDRRKTTILEEAIKNFNFKDDAKVLFYCNKKHLNFKHSIEKIIKKYKLNADTIFIEDTKGQAHTAFICSEYIKSNYQNYFSEKPIAFFNGDTVLKNRNINDLIKDMENSYGLIDSFISEDPKFSFVKINQDNSVIDIEEKVCISKNATSGLYFFYSALIYMEEFMLGKYMDSIEEIYISYIYKDMIKKNMDIKCFQDTSPDNTIILGTPEEYTNHLDSNY